jgi:hypothetical protein
MRKFKVLVAVACVATTFVAPAFGGAEANRNVVVGTNTGQGALGTAWNSSDTAQIIGCTLEATTVGTPTITAECFATDASSNSISCESTSPVIVQAIESINSDSFITFTVASDGSTCESIRVETSSYLYPKNAE